MPFPAERLDLDDDLPHSVKLRHMGRYIKAIKMVPKWGGFWLDIGCGTGYGTFLVDIVADVAVGIDNNAQAIQKAKTDWPRAQFVATSVFSYPLHHFDVVLMVEFYEHLSQADQVRVLDFVARRQLKRHGYLLLTCPLRDPAGPNPLNPYHLWEPSRADLVANVGRWFDVMEVKSEWAVMTTGERQENVYVLAQNQ